MEHSVKEVRVMMQNSIKGLNKFMAPDDIVNIGNSILYELEQYEDYDTEAREMLGSPRHPLNLADASYDAMEKVLSELDDENPLKNIKKLSNVIKDEVIRENAVPFACQVVELLSNEEDEEAVLGAVSCFVDMFQMIFGEDSLSSIEFSVEMESLIKLASAGFCIDMMGDEIESPPETLYRGEPKERDAKECRVVDDTDISTVKSIINRLSLKDEDKEALLEMASEIDEHGNKVHTTTDIVNKAQGIMGEY